ncbi:TPA: hypothetical protein N0F65_008656 [Lagenidium giganteum]|uniref:Thymidine kinase n=1 Tax=Lagenidium giganteum TaxID=4803 RepID=A0AAV2ZAK6_9STRA|nr:TPA: hypothetical protein N0F65_008656 [Lagenidium giganteum]
MIILGPSFSGKNNLVFYILKNSPNVFSHLHIIARNPNNIRKNKDDSIELVIIDDYSNDQVLQNTLFSHYFTRGRHFKCLLLDSVKGELRYNFKKVVDPSSL